MRGHFFLSCVHQQEATRTVGVFRLSRLHTHLAVQRRLLVTGNPRDWNTRTAFTTDVGLTVHFRRFFHFRHHGERDIKFGEDLFIPLQGVDVEQHSTGCVGVIGHMHTALSHFPH
ncbi:Uncharacterised protein [Vibrio cholerae]|nr:Uncharacterised protein [Vibrio cholerae]